MPSEHPTATHSDKRRDKPPGRKLPGTGIPPRRSIRILRWARRITQATTLGLFLFFLTQTTYRGSFNDAADMPVRLPFPVELFFLINPYAALVTLLTSHTVYRGLLWALATIAVTLIFGRAFCGWVCPFGTLHHFFGWLLPSRKNRGAARVAANRTHPVRQRVKYYLLYAFLGAAAAGSAFGGAFDPIALAVRGIGLSVLPGLQYAVGAVLRLLADSNVRVLQGAADVAQFVLSRTLWQASQFHYHDGWILGVAFVALVFLNRIIPRFWCRVLCPLGALLGVTARHALVGMEKNHARCTDCNLCLVHCQGADSPQGGVNWRQDECHVCLNCENACPEGVIRFRFLPGRESTTTRPDTRRRTALASVAAGATMVPLARSADSLDVNYEPRLIRPPGAVEEREFLARCIRCGECMKVCPNNALHPALLEAGIEGIWTPILIPRIGYCEHSCVLCGQVCPTGAIRRLTEKEKTGVDQPPVRMGTAFYDYGRCLPWAMQTPCIVCEEFCPTSPKAIWTEQVEVPLRDSKPSPDGGAPAMKTVKLQRPHVDPSLCIGCGACEKVCPVQDRPAIYVTSVGESRSRVNVILLDRKPS